MNILGNIKKVITSYSNPNDLLNPSQTASNSGGAEYSTASENNSTITLLKDESKFIKEKYNQLLKENELLKQSIFTNSNQSNSQITKIFKEFKSAFFSYDSNTETNKSIRDFKNFLFQNLLLYNSVEEEDIDVLNAINITDSDWNNNKDIFIFKQNLLERNYNQLMENLIVSNELNSFLKDNGLVADRIPTKITTVNDNIEKQYKSASANNYEDYSNTENNPHYNDNYKNSSYPNSTKSIEKDKRSDNTKSSFENKTNPLGNKNEKNVTKPVKSNILEDLIKDDDLHADVVASIFSKSVQEKLKASNENLKNPSSSSNSINFNTQTQTKSDNTSKQNSNKNTLKFDELLEPDVEFMNIKENLDKEVLVGEKNLSLTNNLNLSKNSSVKDPEPIKNTIKSPTHTADIISDILKDNQINIQSLVSNVVGKGDLNPKENKNLNFKPGRVKSPLDDEEEDNDEGFISLEKEPSNNILNSNISDNSNLVKINSQNLQSPVIENAKRELEILKEKQDELEKNLFTPSKIFGDLEANNFNYIPKQEVRETETPFNTPMNSEHFSEPKFISSLKLGNYHVSNFSKNFCFLFHKDI